MTAATGEVSVVIPARDRPELLARALRSVSAQTLQPCEVLVVDDGSGLPLADALGETVSAHVRFVRYSPGVNAAHARNRGLEAARGDYVALLDADDWWDPDHLETGVASLRENGWTGVIGPYTAVYADGVEEMNTAPAGVLEDSAALAAFLFEAGGLCRTSTMVVMADAARDTGFDDALEKHQDWDFALRLAQRGVVGFDDRATVFVDYGAAMRMSGRANAQASLDFLRKHEAALRRDSRAGFILRAAQSAALRADRPGVRQLLAELPTPGWLRERLRARLLRVLALHPVLPHALRHAYIAWRRLRARPRR